MPILSAISCRNVLSFENGQVVGWDSTANDFPFLFTDQDQRA